MIRCVEATREEWAYQACRRGGRSPLQRVHGESCRDDTVFRETISSDACNIWKEQESKQRDATHFGTLFILAIKRTKLIPNCMKNARVPAPAEFKPSTHRSTHPFSDPTSMKVKRETCTQAALARVLQTVAQIAHLDRRCMTLWRGIVNTESVGYWKKVYQGLRKV